MDARATKRWENTVRDDLAHTRDKLAVIKVSFYGVIYSVNDSGLNWLITPRGLLDLHGIKKRQCRTATVLGI